MQGGAGMGGGGIDRPAGVAMFIMEQAMAGGSSGTQEGASFDASLAEALRDGAKKVADNLKRQSISVQR